MIMYQIELYYALAQHGMKKEKKVVVISKIGKEK